MRGLGGDVRLGGGRGRALRPADGGAGPPGGRAVPGRPRSEGLGHAGAAPPGRGLQARRPRRHRTCPAAPVVTPTSLYQKATASNSASRRALPIRPPPGPPAIQTGAPPQISQPAPHLPGSPWLGGRRPGRRSGTRGAGGRALRAPHTPVPAFPAGRPRRAASPGGRRTGGRGSAGGGGVRRRGRGWAGGGGGGAWGRRGMAGGGRWWCAQPRPWRHPGAPGSIIHLARSRYFHSTALLFFCFSILSYSSILLFFCSSILFCFFCSYILLFFCGRHP